MSLPANFDELLSGYLDGELTEAERLQVEGVLADSAEAKEQLEELRRNRAALRSSTPKESVRKLPSDFANRVISEAQRQAVEVGLPPTHHVRRGADIQVTPKRNVGWRGSMRPLAAMATVAAVLILGWLVAKGLTGKRSPTDEIEVVQQSPVSKDRGSPFPVEITPENAGERSVESELKPLPDSLAFVSNGKKVDFNVDQFQILLTLDLFPTQEAWDKNVVESVLNDASISASSRIVSSSVAEAIDKTRSLKSAETEQGEAYVIFVGANNRTLDRVTLALQRRKDMQTTLDMVMDRPREGLLGKLLQSIASDSPLKIPFAATSMKQSGVRQAVEMKRPIAESSGNAEPVLQSPTELGTLFGEDDEALGFMLLIVHAPR
jgi:negative regulator of sigma E activity